MLSYDFIIAYKNIWNILRKKINGIFILTQIILLSFFCRAFERWFYLSSDIVYLEDLFTVNEKLYFVSFENIFTFYSNIYCSVSRFFNFIFSRFFTRWHKRRRDSKSTRILFRRSPSCAFDPTDLLIIFFGRPFFLTDVVSSSSVYVPSISRTFSLGSLETCPPRSKYILLNLTIISFLAHLVQKHVPWQKGQRPFLSNVSS